MSDIDFDELDRAVASVIGPASTSEPVPVTTGSTPVAQPPTPAATQPTPVPVSVAPSVAAPAPTAVPVYAPPVNTVPVVSTVPATPQPVPTPQTFSAPQPAATSAQALHSVVDTPAPRGRFLDFVSPAKPAVAATPQTPPTIAPVTTVASRPLPSMTRPNVAPAATNGAFVSDFVSPKPTQAPTQPVTAPVTRAAAPSQPAVPTQAPSAPTANFFATSDQADLQKPGELTPSPFIPDAKVEKRPLGAFSGEPQAASANDAFRERLVAVESDNSLTEIGGLTAAPATKTASIVAPVAVAEPTPVIQPSIPAPKIRPEKAPKYGKGTFIWVTVAIAVMLIGFGVGASLYFLVLQ